MDFVVTYNDMRFAFLGPLMRSQRLLGLRREPIAHIACIRDLVRTGEKSF